LVSVALASVVMSNRPFWNFFRAGDGGPPRDFQDVRSGA
jgi:hypothetical protein